MNVPTSPTTETRRRTYRSNDVAARANPTPSVGRCANRCTESLERSCYADNLHPVRTGCVCAGFPMPEVWSVVSVDPLGALSEMLNNIEQGIESEEYDEVGIAHRDLIQLRYLLLTGIRPDGLLELRWKDLTGRMFRDETP